MRKGGTAGQEAVATVVGVSAVVTSFSGTFIALATPAEAVAAAGQDVNNDWGQTAAEVTEEVTLVVDADAVVVATRTRYLAALSSYASLKHRQAVAFHAYRSAVTTPTKPDDARTLTIYQTISARVYTAAREVVASQLAMTQVVDATVAKVRSLHYIPAPYVALPSTPVGLTTLGASGQITRTWSTVAGAATHHVYRDGIQVAVTLTAVFLDTGLDNGVSHSYRVIATTSRVGPHSRMPWLARPQSSLRPRPRSRLSEALSPAPSPRSPAVTARCALSSSSPTTSLHPQPGHSSRTTRPRP